MLAALRWVALGLLAACAPPEAPLAPGRPAQQLPVVPAPVVHDYTLAVRLEPEKQQLWATATLVVGGLSGTSVDLFLNGEFGVQAVSVDGLATQFEWGDPKRKMPYVDAARVLEVALPRGGHTREIVLEYSGAIETTLFDVNMISTDLVELAIYAAYYPMLAQQGPFPYTLALDLPGDWTVVTRGRRTGLVNRSGRSLQTWRAELPGRDIVLVASPNLEVREHTSGGVTVSVFFRELPPAAAEAALAQAVASLEYFAARWGDANADALKVVFSPRAGWGYSRTGMFVVSEQRHINLAQGGSDGGPPDAGAHGNAHEISHFWWSVADPRTEHDWINESLAEYSATADSRRRDPALWTAWADAHARAVKAAAPTTGITATRSDDEHRYVNWYQRGALMWMCAEAELGTPVLDGIARQLLDLGRARRVTTADVRHHLRKAGLPTGWATQWLDTADTAPIEACRAGLR